MSASQVSVGNSSTALVVDERNEFEFDLMGCLDELRWHLIDVEMKDEDRRAIEGFFDGLLQEVGRMTATKTKGKKKILKAARKKTQKWFWNLYKKCKTKKGKVRPLSRPSEPILPLVVYTPMKKPRSDERENEMTAQAEEAEDSIYYLRSDCDAYIAKSPSFFQKIGGDDNPTHKRVPTLETVRIDSAWDPDLYESINDDSFFDLETGIY